MEAHAEDVEYLSDLKHEFQRLGRTANDKVVDARCNVGCGVVLLDCVHTSDVANEALHARHVAATFSAGPNREQFTITIDVTGATQGEDPEEEVVSIESEFFNYEDKRFLPPDAAEIEEFLINSNLIEKEPREVSAPSAKQDYKKRHRWIFGDVFREAILLLKEECGEMDEHLISLGCDENSVYKWLGLMKKS